MTNPKQARQTLGLTQKQMAEICNASLDTAKSWDQGRRIPQGPSARLIEILVILKGKGWLQETLDELDTQKIK